MEHFIETVNKYPCLWNTAAIEYRDQELKDAAWAEIMKETDMSSVKEVKQKWKKLRDSYRDALKRQSEMLAKEPTNPAKKNYPWKYMSLMRFLQPHMNNRKKMPESPSHSRRTRPVENGHAHNDTHSEESDSEAESCPKRKSVERLTVIDRKLDYLCKTRPLAEARHLERQTPDPLDIFFNGMCQSTKRFPSATQIKIKKILFEAVIEAEEAVAADQQTYASMWAQQAMTSSSSEAGNS